MPYLGYPERPEAVKIGLYTLSSHHIEMKPDLECLSPYFLGPAAENADYFEEMVLEFLRDHLYWRRNFHPEDGQRISTRMRSRPEFEEFKAKVRAELYALSAELKRAVPAFHPRYIGHMTTDLFLPALITKLVTTLYNPNNVAEEVAPVTVEHEIHVGEQLAKMFGFNTDPELSPYAWGHLTSGGTVANYEALWSFRAIEYYPLALQAGALQFGEDVISVGPFNKNLKDYTEWELLNLSIDEAIELNKQVYQQLSEGRTAAQLEAFHQLIYKQRIEYLGVVEFFKQHPAIQAPVVMVASSAHYSWEKGLKLLGFGAKNLIRIQVDDHMRLDSQHLQDSLATAFAEERKVLAVIGILGSTEFGTFDPIHEIVGLRDQHRANRQDFSIHVDAAWGGYLTSVFRRANGAFVPREEIAKEFHYFPTERIYQAFHALEAVDSITVDPHKLGYVPYSAGAFIARNSEITDFISQKAAYVFDIDDNSKQPSRREALHNLGQYILEGSKSGASAATVYVTHKLLPLHCEGFGKLLKQTIKTAEYFWDIARFQKGKLGDDVLFCAPFEPDSNLICLALNPVNNSSLAEMNRFSRAVFKHMKVDPEQPVQLKAFIGSYTSLSRETLSGSQMDAILSALKVDPTTFRSPPNGADEADHIFILRHTLMNPWLMAPVNNSQNYIDLYWDFLAETVAKVLGSFQGRR